MGDIDVKGFTDSVRLALKEPAVDQGARLLRELSRATNRTVVITSLLSDRESRVREWGAWAAQNVLGREGIPFLIRMSHSDRDETNRMVARSSIEDLDPDALVEILPDLVRDMARARDPFGQADNAMWMMARMRALSAAPSLREFAGRYPYGEYGHMMPLVLAEWIESPLTLAQRIRTHDHSWMFWLVEAAVNLGDSAGAEAIAEVAQWELDQDCRAILNDAIARLKRRSAISN